MATIIEGASWTLTEQAACLMEEKGLIKKCDVDDHIDVLEVDKPIYHRHLKAPDWFGFTTVHGSIIEAEKEVENGQTKRDET